jgi:hypothetical protein
MPVRTRLGIAEALSGDRGRIWRAPRSLYFAGPDTRFFIGPLRSGRFLLIYHRNTQSRTHLWALLSEDEGRSWPYCLVLDERQGVSYPDAVQAGDGRIYVSYDRDRCGAREVLMAVISEEDICGSAPAGAVARLKQMVNRASPST